MKKLLLSFLFLPLASGLHAQKKQAPVNTSAQTYKSLSIGSDMPMSGIMLMGADNKPTSLMQAKKERGLLVMFSCNTCPYVIKGQTMTHQAMNEAMELGIGMVILNSNEAQRGTDDSRESMLMYSTQQQYTVPYLIDEQSQLANAFGATRTPEVFLFNGEGKLVYKGAMEDNPAEPAKTKVRYLSDAMRALNAGKPIQPAETKSIGCSIKRAAS